MVRNLILPSIRVMFLLLFVTLMVLGRFQLWLIIYLVGVVLSLFFGRIYCAYACPMNTSMKPVQRLSQKIGLQREHTPAWLKNTRLPYVVLIFSLISMFLGRRIFGMQLPVLLLLFVASLVITVFVKSEVWHNSLCPYSILLRLGSFISKRSHTVQPELCIGCSKCQKVCPAGAIEMSSSSKKAAIATELCHQCTDCVSVCPTDAISYTSFKRGI